MQHDAVVVELRALQNLRSAKSRQEHIIQHHVSRLVDLLLDMEVLNDEDAERLQ
jgi:hypothetical protein